MSVIKNLIETQEFATLPSVATKLLQLLEFEDMMINHLSMYRIFTSAGFDAQKKMIYLIFKDKFFRRKFINKFFNIVLPRNRINQIKKSLGLDRKTRKARAAFIKNLIGLNSTPQ